MWRALLLSLLLLPLLALLASAEIERNPGSRAESGLGDPRGAGKGHPPQHMLPVEQETTPPAQSAEAPSIPQVKVLTLAELGQAKLIVHGCRSAGRAALRSNAALAAQAAGPPPAGQPDPAADAADHQTPEAPEPSHSEADAPAANFLDQLARAGESAKTQAAATKPQAPPASPDEAPAKLSDELVSDLPADSAETPSTGRSANAAGTATAGTAEASTPAPAADAESEVGAPEPKAPAAESKAAAAAPSREIRSRTHPGEDNARGRDSVDKLLNHQPEADTPDSPAGPTGKSGAESGAAEMLPSTPEDTQPSQRDRYPNSGSDAAPPAAAGGSDAWDRGTGETAPATGAGQQSDVKRGLDPETLLGELDQQSPGARPEAAALEAPQLERGLVLSASGAAGNSGILNAQLGAAAPVNLALPVERPSMPDYKLPSGLLSISRGNHKQKTVALTFDDGPHPLYTSQLLAVLEHYQVPATFFFVGLQAQKYPQWVKMAHQGGHEIGSHTYDHFRLPKLPPAEQAYQLDEYQRLIEGLIGVTPRFLRPPGGQIDKSTEQLLKKRGMVAAMWDVALNDTGNGKTGNGMLKTTLKKVRNGSIILAHDGVQATVDMLPELIAMMRAEGYTFVTMSELASGL